MSGRAHRLAHPPASSTFATLSLVRAMAPVKIVLESFQQEHKDLLNVEVQGCFATVIQETLQTEYHPGKSYLKSLVRQYVSQVDASSHDVQDEALLELILYFSMMKDSALPDPLESCHVSFSLAEEDLLRLQVVPRHNNVALKVWEAGACLAEYLIQNPHYIKGKKGFELGAGVGLTGLVAMACCEPLSIHMTDYTEAGLNNLQHNIDINSEWIQKRVGSHVRLKEILTLGYLDWEEYAKETFLSSTNDEHAHSKEREETVTKMSEAQVLLGADIVYDVPVIPCLAQTVKRFLSTKEEEKIAIFATTLRKKDTFDAFELHMREQGIECEYVESEILESMPYTFPVYNVQPRSDVRICFMRVS